MLGHASAAITLDRYADLFDDELDDVADRLDTLQAASRGRVADLLRTEAPSEGPPSPPRRWIRRSNAWRRGESNP